MERASNGGADGPTAYLDSGAITALSDPDDMHHEDAVRTCSAAVNLGRCRLVTSPLAAMEAVGSVRKKVTTSHKPRPGSEAERARADGDAGGAAALVLDRMGYMDAQGLLKIVSPKGWSPGLALLHGRVLVHAGRAARTAGGRNYGYRGVGPCGWLRLALAVAVRASAICTAGEALAGVEGNDEEFGRMRIQMARGPLIGRLAGAGGRPVRG